MTIYYNKDEKRAVANKRKEAYHEKGTRVRHLTKRYGQHLALDNVNLTLEKGEVYGLSEETGQVRRH